MRTVLQGRGGRLLGVLCALVLCLGFLPARAFAAGGESYVALGDSISDGYGVGEGESFPELVAAKRGFSLTSYASSEGFTSTDLVAQLNEGDVAASVAAADVITITVGGNDLMEALYGYLAEQANAALPVPGFTADAIEGMLASGEPIDMSMLDSFTGFLDGFPSSSQARAALVQLSGNLAKALSAIKTANPDVTCFVVNQYNPYGHLGDSLATVVNTFDTGVQALNAGLSGVASASGVTVVDAYGVFKAATESPCNAAIVDGGGKVNLDFHPNAHGHDLLAQAVDALLPAAPEDPETPPVDEPENPPVQDGPNWAAIAADLAAAKPGSTVEVDMEGTTKMPAAALAALAGRDVTARVEMAPGIAWEIDGAAIPADAALSDIDLGIEVGTAGIPADLVGLVAGMPAVQATLAHDGPFGFTLTLAASVAGMPAGVYANAYSYDEDAEALNFEGSAVVSEDGVARLSIDHASQWLVSLDSRSHALPFPDALEGEWYSEAVRWAWLSGAMTGYDAGPSAGLFGTGDALTRAQLASALHKAAGEPEADPAGAAAFVDCSAGAWYAEAVAWAASQGLMTGYDDGTGRFGPEDELTREQLAAVFWRAAGEPAADADLSGFPDGGETSAWALAPVEWAVETGLLGGYDDTGELGPADPLERAQLAAVLMRLAQEVA